jgi:hypothetical protein
VGHLRGPKGEVHFIEGVGLGIFSGAMSILDSIDDEYEVESAGRID